MTIEDATNAARMRLSNKKFKQWIAGARTVLDTQEDAMQWAERETALAIAKELENPNDVESWIKQIRKAKKLDFWIDKVVVSKRFHKAALAFAERNPLHRHLQLRWNELHIGLTAIVTSPATAPLPSAA